MDWLAISRDFGTATVTLSILNVLLVAWLTHSLVKVRRDEDLRQKRREQSSAVVEILAEWLRPENMGQPLSDHARWKLQMIYWRNILTLDRDLIGILFPRLANAPNAVSPNELIVQTRAHMLKKKNNPDLKATDLNNWWPREMSADE